MRVLLVHGPNLNRLGSRDPGVYGTVTLDEIVEAAGNHGRPLGLELLPFQSNHEGDISDPALREPFRQALITATAATTVIAGKGLGGYLEALDFLAERRHS